MAAVGSEFVDTPQLDDAWLIAKERFLRDLDDKERALFDKATLENLYYSSSNDQKDDQKCSKTRSTLQKLQPLVSAVQDYASSFDTVANIAPLYLAPIWGSVRVVLVLARNHGRFYDRIIETFERIGDLLPRFRDYQRIFNGKKHQRLTQALSSAYLDIVIMCTEFGALLLVQRKSVVKRVLQPQSPGINAHIETVLNRFRHHRKSVEKEAEICHMIEEKESREMVLRNNALAEAKEREARLKELISNMSRTDYRNKHSRMQALRHPGTGGWFKALLEFKAWFESICSSVICCYGIPGCGKSVLVSSLIDELNNPAVDDDLKQIRTLAYYYCDHTDKRTLTFVNIFGTIAQQLLRQMGQSSEIPDGLLNLIELAYQDNNGPSPNGVSSLLLAIIQRLPEATIFVDGLDEAPDREMNLFFAKMEEIISLATTSVVKLFISSREDITQLNNVPDTQPFHVHITTSSISADIDDFIGAAVRDLIRQGKLIISDPGLEKEICRALAGGAKGMFLWVKFQLDELCAKLTDGSIRQVLQNLPRDLGETYTRLLSRIDDAERRAYVQNMFRWVIFARRPLTVDELREAIAFDISDTEWDHAKIPNELLRLIRACGNLILINDETQEVQLAHYTVEQYLLNRENKYQPYFYLTKGESNWKLAQICVAYLSFSDFETQIIPYNDTTTPKFAPLEKAVVNQSLIPLGITAATAIRMITKLRGEKRLPTNIEYARHIPIQTPQNAPTSLTKKYHLLSYVVDNWLWHSQCFTTEASWPSGDTRGRLLFENLALDKTLLFQFRPWESTPVRKDLPYLVPIGWAISANHIPLLETIFTKVLPARYLVFAAEACWQEEQLKDTDIPDDLLRAWRTYPLDISRNVGDWGTWLYCQLLRAARDGKFEMIRMCFKEYNHRFVGSFCVERLISHLVLEAAISDQERMVKWFCSSASFSMWLTCDSNIVHSKVFRCNAIEHAALHGFGTFIGVLLPICPVSERFVYEVVGGGLLATLVQTRDINKLKWLLKVLSEPFRPKARPKSASLHASISSSLPLDSQVKPRRLRFFSRSSSAKTDVKISSESGTDPPDPKDIYIAKLQAILIAASLGDEEALAELLYAKVSKYEDKSTTLDEHHGALFCAIANDHPKTVKYVLASGRTLLPNDFLFQGFAGPSHDNTHTEYLAFIPSLEIDGHDRSPLNFAIRLAKTDESGLKYQEIIDMLLGYEGPIFASPEERVWLETEANSRQRDDRRTRLKNVSLEGKDSHIPVQVMCVWDYVKLIYPICWVVVWVVLFFSIFTEVLKSA